MKRTLFAAAFSFLAAAAFSFEIEKPFFSGTTGFLSRIESDRNSNKFGPTASAESYFAGQFDFSGKLFLRGEFYTLSDSLFEEEFTEKNAFFRIEEVSATYKVTGLSASHYFSAFRGNYEPFGSDIFLQRHFGIAKISSNLTESYHGIEGASIKPVYALGGSYTLHTNTNHVLSFSAFKDENYMNNGKKMNSVNFEGRYSSVFDYAVIDLNAGIYAPTESDTKDDNSLLNISEVLMNTGINALLGKKNSFMLYTQFGVDKIFVKKIDSSNDSVNLKNFYILIEPRIPVSDFYFNPSFFNFPMAQAMNMTYLRTLILKHPNEDSVLGFNFNLVNENLYLGASKITGGIHGTLAMTSIDSSELKDAPSTTIKNADKTFILTPYATIEVFGGKVTGSFSIDTKEFSDSPSKAVFATIGFKTSF